MREGVREGVRARVGARGRRCEALSRSGAARSPGKGPRARRGHNAALSCAQALSGEQGRAGRHAWPWARVGPCGRLWHSLPAAVGLPIKKCPRPRVRGQEAGDARVWARGARVGP